MPLCARSNCAQMCVYVQEQIVLNDEDRVNRLEGRLSDDGGSREILDNMRE